MIRRIVTYYIYSNLHIALCAAVYVIGAYCLVSSTVHWSFIGIVFSGTVVSYNLHRWIGYYKASVDDRPRRFNFVIKNQNNLLIISGLLGIGSIWALFYLPTTFWVSLVPLAIITLAYLMPIFGTSNKRLRDLPYVKIFAIASVWSALFMVPISLSSELSLTIQILLFTEKFLFFLALTIPFDIRDRNIDRQQKVKTFGTQLSLAQNKALAWTLLLVSSLIALYLCHLGLYIHSICGALILFYILMAYLCAHSTFRRSELFYLGLMDGMILLIGLIYILPVFF